jgi:hypothetical protein
LADTDRIDEATLARSVREEAERNVNGLYSGLLQDLGLTKSEMEALLSFLIETQEAATSTDFSPGTAIGEQARMDGIAAIIGDAKLQEFLELERNLSAYSELHRIDSVLSQSGNPIAETQRDDLVRALVQIAEADDLGIPGSSAERDSVEYLKFRLTQIDERERLLIEQASSILSANQVRILFDDYQRQSYRRAAALDSQLEARANGTSEDTPLWYPAVER